MIDAAARTIPAETAQIDAAGYRLAVARWRAARAGEHAPILFLGGFAGSMASAETFLTAFDDRDVISFDLPGLGESPDSAMPYTPMAVADCVAAVLDHFGIDQVDIVGLSWGGLLAQQFAIQHGARVRKLILVATSTGMVMVPPDLSQWAAGAGDDGVDHGIVQRLIGTASDWSHGVFDQLKRQRPRLGSGLYLQSLCFVGWTSAPWLPFFLRAPTLILANRHDPVVPLPNAELLQQLIPGAQLRQVGSGGHFFLLSEIAKVRPLITEFLDG